jgi:hypothetical protein
MELRNHRSEKSRGADSLDLDLHDKVEITAPRHNTQAEFFPAMGHGIIPRKRP